MLALDLLDGGTADLPRYNACNGMNDLVLHGEDVG
jgi:hypothetical protein